jgi:hypothetical protein
MSMEVKHTQPSARSRILGMADWIRYYVHNKTFEIVSDRTRPADASEVHNSRRDRCEWCCVSLNGGLYLLALALFALS